MLVGLVALPLASGACQPGSPSTSAAGVPDAASIRAAARGVPADPGPAAEALVARVMGSDPTQAAGATAEVLRRAGIPVVSPAGPVVALPSHYMLGDAPVYAPLVPGLARAVRSGRFYTPNQLAELFTDDAGGPALDAATLVGTLAGWGADAADPAESRFAGAAVRALSAWRGQLLYPGAELDRLAFDPLQTVLFLEHAYSRASLVKPGRAAAAAGELPGVLPAYAAGDPCSGVKDAKDASPQIAETNQEVTKENVKKAVEHYGEEAGRAFGHASQVYDKGTDVVSLLILLMGATIELKDNHGGKTHYRHDEGDKSKNVTFTATAKFDSALAQNRIACYNLAGIDVPPDGPLKDFRVRWYIDEVQDVKNEPVVGQVPEGEGKHVKVVSRDSDKLSRGGGGGEVTGPSGTSTLEIYPKRETKPGAGAQRSGTVTVTASLDKDDFPFKMKDLVGLANPAGAAGSALWKLWDIAMSVIKKAGLPSASIPLTVEYHGADIYQVKGHSKLWLFFVEAPVDIDLHSCEGMGGPWKGKFTMVAGATFFGQIGADLAGEAEPSGTVRNENLNFTVDPKSSADQPFKLVDELGGRMTLTKRPRKDEHIDGPVGRAQFTIGGDTVEIPAAIAGSSATWIVRGVPTHPDCESNPGVFDGD